MWKKKSEGEKKTGIKNRKGKRNKGHPVGNEGGYNKERQRKRVMTTVQVKKPQHGGPSGHDPKTKKKGGRKENKRYHRNYAERRGKAGKKGSRKGAFFKDKRTATQGSRTKKKRSKPHKRGREKKKKERRWKQAGKEKLGRSEMKGGKRTQGKPTSTSNNINTPTTVQRKGP